MRAVSSRAPASPVIYHRPILADCVTGKCSNVYARSPPQGRCGRQLGRPSRGVWACAVQQARAAAAAPVCGAHQAHAVMGCCRDRLESGSQAPVSLRVLQATIQRPSERCSLSCMRQLPLQHACTHAAGMRASVHRPPPWLRSAAAACAGSHGSCCVSGALERPSAGSHVWARQGPARSGPAQLGFTFLSSKSNWGRELTGRG